MNTSDLAAVLGRVPSGLFVLTLAHDGAETGMLASWVMQAGFEPPMISLALKHGRYVADWLAAGSPFVLNLLAEGNQKLIGHFGRGFDPGQPAFTGLELIRTPDGQPALADALGYLECRPKTHINSGDHRIFLAEVIGGELKTDQEPYIHIRKNGLRY
jgi:flavin reductase (DIM6/NTAB) family NADH-FMN oxidoreductase RutF